jgi:uncharacterized protein (DUF2147 family)
MKHTDYFNTFLAGTVNLGKTKLDVLETRADVIFKALQSDAEIGATVLSKQRQGSWAQRTIIEPQNGKEFDADIMVRLSRNLDWADDPRQYLNAVYSAVGRHPVLGQREYERMTRCVRIHYGTMHVDVVPYVIQADGTKAIVNRKDNVFEPTDPAAFTEWMQTQDKIADGNLRKVIRLLKCVRDHKDSWTGTRSIILTTLLGERVTQGAKLWTPGAYADVPTALLTIVTDLDKWLDPQWTKPTVTDPAGTGLTFDHRWKPESFDQFKGRIKVYAQQIDDAYWEEDPDDSVTKWQMVFGDAFVAPTPAAPPKFGTGSSAGATTTTGRSGRAG